MRRFDRSDILSVGAGLAPLVFYFTRRKQPVLKLCACIFLCLFALIPILAPAQQHTRQPSWIATWAASPQPVELKAAKIIEDQTVRQRVRVSIGGSQLRLRLSNEYGSPPLQIGSVTIALPNGPAGIQPDSI